MSQTQSKSLLKIHSFVWADSEGRKYSQGLLFWVVKGTQLDSSITSAPKEHLLSALILFLLRKL